MPPKKKPAGAEEDESTLQIMKAYKKSCDKNGEMISKLLKEKIDQAIEEGENVEKIHMWEDLGPVGIRAIFESFSEINYLHTKSIRLWKVRCEDEGTRTICMFINRCATVQILDLLDNNIGKLGCEFLGKCFMSGASLVKLKLDHNNIGNEGLEQLVKGLAQNTIIEKLSLNYCNINENGAKYIQQILAFIDSKLEKLKLQGNIMKNQGIIAIMKSLQVNNTLGKINLADTGLTDFTQDEDAISKICETIENNKNLGAYVLNFNEYYDESAKKLVEKCLLGKHIYQLELPEHINNDIIVELKAFTKKNKPKKKGKKGGKKKKK